MPIMIGGGGSSGSSGDVVGPASATDGVPALFDGTTGKLLKNSTPTGTGNVVRATSPTLVTPVLGVATGTSLALGAGTVSAPALTLNDADTGIYSPAAGQIAFAMNGTNRLDFGVTTANTWTVPGANLTVGSTITGANVASGAYIYWTAKSSMRSPSDGLVLMETQAGGDFGRLQFGGTTSSFPAIKRNATAINIRLADDSADAPLTASSISASTFLKSGSYTVATVPSAATSGAGARIYVSDEVGGATPAFSDATNWRRYADRAIIS